VTYLFHMATMLALLSGTPAADARRSAVPWTWTDAGTAVDELTISIVRGRVEAVTGDDGAIDVRIDRTASRSAPESMTFRTEHVGRTVTIEDRYPAPTEQWKECLPPSGSRGDFWRSDVQARVVVRVPAHVKLTLRVMQGSADVRRLSGPRTVVVTDEAMAAPDHN
jgi:hypothetical protein